MNLSGFYYTDMVWFNVSLFVRCTDMIGTNGIFRSFLQFTMWNNDLYCCPFTNIKWNNDKFVPYTL